MTRVLLSALVVGLWIGGWYAQASSDTNYGLIMWFVAGCLVIGRLLVAK